MENETIDAPVGTEPANESITDNQTQEVVTESAKTSDNQEGQTTGTEQDAVSNAPQQYSYEELQNVKNYTELDPARLPKSIADAVNAAKAAQGELTKVQQRLAAQEKAPPPSQRPSDPRQAFAYDVFQAFDQDDYAGVTRQMNSIAESIERRKLEFTELQFTDPEKAAQLKQGIIADMEFKTRLDNGLAQAYNNKNLNNSLYGDVDAAIFSAMPDFKKVAPDIGQFAMKELHFDQSTIEDTMDAKVYIPGLMSKYGITQQQAAKMAKNYVVQLTKGMHDVYMRVSGKGIKDKETRTPPKTETPVSGHTHKSKTAKEMNDNEIEREINRLKFGGR